MPDFVVYTYRNGSKSINGLTIDKINKRISPDNINAEKPVTIKRNNSFLVIFDPIPDLKIGKFDLEIGHSIKVDPPSSINDGCFCRISLDEDGISVQNDTLGINTIWYFFDDERFIASSSQRAIMTFLGNFTFNLDAAYAFLYSGCLGFGLSWDKRIACCPRNEKISLHAGPWSLSKATIKSLPSFSESGTPERDQTEGLASCLDKVFERFDIPFQRTTLPLSGGYDSRYILLQLLKKNIRPKTVTWGHPDSLLEDGNDASVAQKLANHFELDHSFIPSCTQRESIEQTFDRFIRLGEGRVEQIHAYMDGFQMWKELRESGVSGVIRGDEIFGWWPAITDMDVLKSINYLFGSDYSNADIISQLLNNHEFSLNRLHYEKANGESHAVWRDRLYQEYRVPYFLSPLNYLKSKYVNVYTPLLSRSIIENVRKTSDQFRTEKSVFTNIVDSMFSSIPIATKPAIVSFKDLSSKKDFIEVVKKKLVSCKNNGLLSEDGVDKLLLDINKKQPLESKLTNLKQIVPTRVRSLIKRCGLYGRKPHLDPMVISFRVYIIYCVNELFKEDSQAGPNPK